MDEARRVLSTAFGYEAFRPGQAELVEAVLEGRDVLGVMPTGAGKSLVYQVPAIAAPGVAIVVSPLVSLMGDQVQALLDSGVRAAYLNSTLSPSEQGFVLLEALGGAFDILYVAPERLSDPRFTDFAARAHISLVAVDEAHCVSQWGQDFRPSYLAIGEFIEGLPERPPVCALTATATSRVRADITRLLGLEDPLVLVTGFDRPNLRFDVERLAPKGKLDRIVGYVREHSGDSGIVYCSTRKHVEEVCEELQLMGIAATRYHAGLPAAERLANQTAFINDDAPVMVATNAFGMGIDKSNVRFVIHHNLPGSMEAYYQEAGRAGRDGEPAECLLLWSDGDISTCRYFIEAETENEELSPEEEEIFRASRRRMLEAMVGYCYTAECLRGYILRYFGETAGARCGNCGNCESGASAVDVTNEARAVMRCVQQLRGRFGKGVVVDVLRGARTARIEQLGLATCRCFGDLAEGAAVRGSDEPLAQAVPAARIREVVELLAAGGYLVVSEGKYPTVGFGPRFREAAEPDFSLSMKAIARKPKKKARRREGPAQGFGLERALPAHADDDALFERLRALRRSIAEESEIPPYIVFSDAALRDMCARRPTTDDAFLEVSGVGAVKLERYGEAFLKEIRTFVEGA